VRAADPDRTIVALSGDYDFQFMIEELAVGAQHKLPYLHVVVNNSYLGLIRQAQRGFEMDFEVSLAFENINAARDPDAVPGYGVDHIAVAEALGCKAIRVKSPNEFKDAFARATTLMREFQVPVVMEFILERVTNISMGTEINGVNEFEEILCLDPSLSIKKSQDMRTVEKAKQVDAFADKR
jgi:tartronate-semialdehyde synthase